MHPNLLQFYLNEQKIAYILVDHDLEIVEYNGEISLLGESNQHTSPELLDLIPELVGCEDILQDVLAGHLPRFELDSLNRVDAEGNVHYVTVAILPYVPEETSCLPCLLITLNNVTAWTAVEQTLTQQRNEMSLLKQSLADTNQRLEFILQRYVPKEVGEALLEKRILPELGGELREVTLLFADLRNYTGTSEKQTPNETIEMLHVYIDIASTAIAMAGGVIVNYMGDGIMAMFNAPNEQPEHAQRAVRAGLIMQAMAKDYQEKDSGYPSSLYFGVGINTGPALVGNIGAQWHYQYTAVGDTVNVASRICGHARPGEVLIGESVHAHIADIVEAKALPPIKFKGKTQEVVVYQVQKLNTDCACPYC